MLLKNDRNCFDILNFAVLDNGMGFAYCRLLLKYCNQFVEMFYSLHAVLSSPCGLGKKIFNC